MLPVQKYLLQRFFALIALTDSARLVWYLIVAGTICFLAMSIIVSASMLIVLEYVSYITSARDSISAFVYTPCFSKISTASGFTNAGTASTIHLMFGSPLLSASATHSSEYPLPLKMILLCLCDCIFDHVMESHW